MGTGVSPKRIATRKALFNFRYHVSLQQEKIFVWNACIPKQKDFSCYKRYAATEEIAYYFRGTDLYQLLDN